MIEEWRDIKGYEGKYQVSNTGKVRSLNYKNTGEVRLLKQNLTRNGYLQISLSKSGKSFFYSVHRLVAEAFIPNSLNLEQVNHKDECKTNNVVENLEWCSCQYNLNYGTHNERMRKTQGKAILQFTKDGEFVKEWESMRCAKRELGIINITQALKGRYKTAGGFVWKYK